MNPIESDGIEEAPFVVRSHTISRDNFKKQVNLEVQLPLPTRFSRSRVSVDVEEEARVVPDVTTQAKYNKFNRINLKFEQIKKALVEGKSSEKNVAHVKGPLTKALAQEEDNEFRNLKQGDIQQMLDEVNKPEKAPVRLKRPYNLLGKYGDADKPENSAFPDVNIFSISPTHKKIQMTPPQVHYDKWVDETQDIITEYNTHFDRPWKLRKPNESQFIVETPFPPNIFRDFSGMDPSDPKSLHSSAFRFL